MQRLITFLFPVATNEQRKISVAWTDKTTSVDRCIFRSYNEIFVRLVRSLKREALPSCCCQGVVLLRIVTTASLAKTNAKTGIPLNVQDLGRLIDVLIQSSGVVACSGVAPDLAACEVCQLH